MAINPIALIFFVVFFFIFGFLTGRTQLNSQKSKRNQYFSPDERSRFEKPEPSLGTPEARPAPISMPQPKPGTPFGAPSESLMTKERREVPAGLVEIAQMWRRQGNKELVTEIGGRILNFRDKLTPEQHATISLLLVDLQDWVGIETQLENPVATKIDKNQYDGPIEALGNVLLGDIEIPNSAPSIIAQIDEHLQRLLANSPQASRAIRLMDIAGRGMVIAVGLNMYNEVDDIPDEGIKALIRQAVSEWEKFSSAE
ncbi:MAG: hypothetical protein OEZ02_00980 [Anaerolineae bacterium]|nr:hypothetical protein [Anaerolineae bacterium]